MITGTTLVQLPAGKVLGLQDLQDHGFDPIREDQLQIQVDLWGSGGVLATLATMTVTGGAGFEVATLDANAAAYAPDGFKLLLAAANTEWTSIPYNSGIVTHVGAKRSLAPASSLQGTDGVPHFGHLENVIGETIQAAGVTVVGPTLEIECLATMRIGQQWPSNTLSRPVIVWYRNANNDPATSSSEFRHLGNLVRTSGPNAYTVTVPHHFGQTVPSTAGGDYRIILVGPTFGSVTEAGLAAWTDSIVDLGVITAAAFTTTGQLLLNTVGQWISSFNAQHNNTTGAHTTVTADRVTVGTPTVGPATITGELHADHMRSDRATLGVGASSEGSSSVDGRLSAVDIRADQIVVKPIADAAAVSNIGAVQADGTTKIALRAGDPTVAGGGGELVFPNPDQSVDNTALISLGFAGGDPTLKIGHSSGVAARHAQIMIDGKIKRNPLRTTPFSIEADLAGTETLFLQNIGAGVLDVNMPGGDLTVVNGDIKATNGIFNGSSSGHFFADVQGLNYTIDASGNLTVATSTSSGGYDCNPALLGVGYTYTAPAQWTVPVGPFAGGWTQTSDPGMSYPQHISGIPSHVRSSSALTLVSLKRQLTELFAEYGDNTAANIVISSITMRYIESAGSLQLFLRRSLRDGTGPQSTLATLTAATSGVFTTQTISPVHAVDPLYYYWLELVIDPNGSPADVQVADIDMVITKTGVE